MKIEYTLSYTLKMNEVSHNLIYTISDKLLQTPTAYILAANQISIDKLSSFPV